MSGIHAVDQLVDGGLRKAQCLEIAGPPGSGKELLALEFIMNAVKEETEVLIIGRRRFNLLGCLS